MRETISLLGAANWGIGADDCHLREPTKMPPGRQPEFPSGMARWLPAWCSSFRTILQMEIFSGRGRIEAKKNEATGNCQPPLSESYGR